MIVSVKNKLSGNMYRIEYTKAAVKDIELIKRAKLDKIAKKLIDIIKENPYEKYPPYEKLLGDLLGTYSRRINRHHRLVYCVNEETKTVRVLALWTHYDD